MNQLLQWLSGGDLRSDGMATGVAEFILENEHLIGDLLEGLESTDSVIRARTSDALEKIARKRPYLFVNHLPKLILMAKTDSVMMVRMHLAMLFGHILACDVDVNETTSTLIYLLKDKSVFTKSWAIVSLCITARKFPEFRNQIVEQIAPMQTDNSIAIRSRARKALTVLLEEDAPLPKGWVKSIHLQN